MVFRLWCCLIWQTRHEGMLFRGYIVREESFGIVRRSLCLCFVYDANEQCIATLDKE